MPSRAQPDDYYSDDFDEPDTMISRGKTVRPKSALGMTGKKPSKKTKKRPGTPGRGRAQSAYGHRTGKDLWMNAIKKRQTLMHAGGHRGESPRHKTPIEYWVETLRKTGTGISTESTGMNTFSGLKKTNEKFYPYLSTSHYMRNVMGTEKQVRHEDPTVRPSPGRPAYKTPEEYYDEVLELRKQISAMNQDSATMKTKIRRLEEDNLKKEKEIESLLHPEKSEEIRRALGDRKPDSGAVIHSLKQKILKLEVQLRDRESAYNKLQADLKVTKLEELKAQMEVMFAEIVRLQNLKHTSSPGRGQDTVKVKALNETILRLSRTNEQLQQDNAALKEDLQKALEDADIKPDLNREYDDMNRKELLLTIAKLERRADRAERGLETDSLLSGASGRDGDTFSSKLTLKGSTEQRLTQLDQRETELLEEIHRLKTTIKRLREDRRRRGDELPPTPTPRRMSRQDAGSVYGSANGSAAGSRRPSSARSVMSETRAARIDNFKQKHAATSIQRQFVVLRASSACNPFKLEKCRKPMRNNKQQDEKVERFRQNRAAKKIQHEWLGLRHRQHEEEVEDAAYTIQAAMSAHRNRKSNMRRFHDDADSTATDEDDDVFLIQSSMKGHHARLESMRAMRQKRYDSYEDEDEYYDIRTPGQSRRPSLQRPSSAKGRRKGSLSDHNYAFILLQSSVHTFKTKYDKKPLGDDGLDDDDDDIMF
ncbi:hypothetical protein BaRGS_00000917 [Batillaria attramentaria]|uniref:IQ domain-containing protein E n=1 Tax=Batillaria attramentaria TaxID=370345 RepID=A0ABD0M8S5_9CAEN